MTASPGRKDTSPAARNADQDRQPICCVLNRMSQPLNQGRSKIIQPSACFMSECIRHALTKAQSNPLLAPSSPLPRIAGVPHRGQSATLPPWAVSTPEYYSRSSNTHPLLSPPAHLSASTLYYRRPDQRSSRLDPTCAPRSRVSGSLSVGS